MEFEGLPGNRAELERGLSDADEQALRDYGAAEVSREMAAPRLSEERQEAELALASLEGKKADYGKTLDWIWHKLGSVSVTPRDAPSQTAWLLLQHFQQARGEFFKVYQAYTAKAQKDAAEVKEWHDDNRKQLGFIRKLRKEFPRLGLDGLRDLLKEDQKSVEEHMRSLGYVRVPSLMDDDPGLTGDGVSGSDGELGDG